MSKQNKNKGGSPAPAATPAAAPVRPITTVVSLLKEAMAAVHVDGAVLGEAELQQREGQFLQLTELAASLEKASQDARVAREVAESEQKQAQAAKLAADSQLEAARKERDRATSERKEFEEKSDALQKDKAGLQDQKKEIGAARARLQEDQKVVNAKLQELDVRKEAEELRLAQLETERLEAISRKNAEALQAFRSQRDALQEELRVLQARKAELEAERLAAELASARKAATEEQATLARLRQQATTELKVQFDELSRRAAELQDRERAVLAKEADSAAGFSHANEKLLVGLRAELDSLRIQLAETRDAIAREKAAWSAEREQADAESRRERAQLAKERRLLELEQSDATAVRDAEALDRINRMTVQLSDRDAQIAALTRQLEESQEGILAYQRIGWMVGGRGPQELLARDKEQRERIAELETRIAGMLPDSEQARLRTLEDENDRLERQLAITQAELNLTKTRLGSRDTLEIEVAQLRSQREARERMERVLKDEIRELEAKLGALTEKNKAESPFPECSIIDKREVSPTAEAWRPASLVSLVDEVRSRLSDGVVVDEQTGEKKRLHYRAVDLQLFVAGLAMSRLHLFQGPSGTGKTTLPAAFAKVVDGGQRIIPVQAGWRDRTDLLGHWNAFERRFYESDFLQALYESGAAGAKERPYFIILDEMNLSRVEQYFADFLSALEAPRESDRVIPVMAEGQHGAPSRFIDRKKLPLGRNVWFIGTANHDETTIEFADKTYDRSFVHELPTRPPAETALRPPKSTGPLDLAHLTGLFDAAIKKDGPAARAQLDAFGEYIRDDLRRFDIVWAERLARQVERFVPVVVASGGTLNDGFDHLLTMRLLRKLRRRHDVRSSDLKKLMKAYQDAWALVFSASVPGRALELIEGEIKRLTDASDGIAA